MKEEELSKLPDFYRAISFPTHITRLGNDSLLGSTSLTIKHIYRSGKNGNPPLILDGSFAETVTITHNLGKIYEPYIRIRRKGGLYWQTLPSDFQFGGTLASTVYAHVINITEDSLQLDLFNANTGFGGQGECDLEIYFLDFSTESRFT